MARVGWLEVVLGSMFVVPPLIFEHELESQPACASEFGSTVFVTETVVLNYD